MLNDSRISDDMVWQCKCKCKIAKHIIRQDKVNAEKSIRYLYRILADKISKNYNIKLLAYEVPLSRPQIEQTIGDVIYELVKVVSESNNSSFTEIQTIIGGVTYNLVKVASESNNAPRTETQQIIGGVTYNLVKVASESNNAPRTHIQTTIRGGVKVVSESNDASHTHI